jgi:glycosyltransferase involved in cell wall biosynthesis
MQLERTEQQDLSTSHRTVLVVAQTPPPMHGQAIMTKLFLDAVHQRVSIAFVRMAFSDTIVEVGRLRLQKLAELATLLVKIFWEKFRTKAEILYYPPASPNLVPFFRDVFVLGLTRWMFKKTVFHFHAVGIGEMYTRLPRCLRPLFRIAYFNPDLAICLTHATSVDAGHMIPRHTVVIPNAAVDRNCGHNARAPGTSEQSVPQILFVGMFCEEKGVLDLISACQKLDSLNTPYRLAFAGAPQSHEFALEAHRCAQSLQGEVSILGEVAGDAKWRLYREADIFCFPTHYSAEGFPVVLLEAMMFELPVVSTKWRGIPEIVGDRETGLLVEPGDTSGLANSLKMLLDNSALRETMGGMGRKRYLAHFTAERYQQNMESVLASLAADQLA